MAVVLALGWCLAFLLNRYDHAVQTVRDLTMRQEREDLSEYNRRLYIEKVSDAASVLDREPGLAVARVRPVPGGDFELTVLKDPMAPDPEAVLARMGLKDRAGGFRGAFRVKVKPYLSAEPEIVLRRAETLLAPPPGVQAGFDPDAGVLTLSGEASLGWIQSALRAAPFVPGVLSVESGALLDPREVRALELLNLTDGASVRFAPGSSVPADPPAVRALASELDALARLGAEMETPLTVHVYGLPDPAPASQERPGPAGSPAPDTASAELARDRADAAAGALSGAAAAIPVAAYGPPGLLPGPGPGTPSGEAAGTAVVRARLGDGRGLGVPASPCPGPPLRDGSGRLGEPGPEQEPRPDS
jgi:hypothetical protein